MHHLLDLVKGTDDLKPLKLPIGQRTLNFKAGDGVVGGYHNLNLKSKTIPPIGIGSDDITAARSFGLVREF
jgi:hypothetical protein